MRRAQLLGHLRVEEAPGRASVRAAALSPRGAVRIAPVRSPAGRPPPATPLTRSPATLGCFHTSYTGRAHVDGIATGSSSRPWGASSYPSTRSGGQQRLRGGGLRHTSVSSDATSPSAVSVSPIISSRQGDAEHPTRTSRPDDSSRRSPSRPRERPRAAPTRADAARADAVVARPGLRPAGGSASRWPAALRPDLLGAWAPPASAPTRCASCLGASRRRWTRRSTPSSRRS